MVVGQIHAEFQSDWLTLTTVPQAAIRVTRRATSTCIEARTVEASPISWTWRLTVTAALLVTPVLTVFISVTPEAARDALPTSAFHQALAVARAVDLVRLVHAVVVPITHPLSRDAASIPTAVLFREVAIAVLLVAQIATVVIPITHEAVTQALARVAVKQVLSAVAEGLVTPVITVVVAVTSQLLRDAEPAVALEALAPSTERLLSMFLLQGEADLADTVVALGVVSKLRASEGIRPGGVHHAQDRLTPFLCSLTERSTGKEATPVITINDALREGEATAK